MTQRHTDRARHPANPPRAGALEIAALVSMVALCVALRAFHIGAASLWTDEVFSRYYAELFGLRYLVTDGLSNEATPPTYPLLLRGWIALLGDSEAALRSLSTLASAACVLAVHALGREMGGRSQGLLGALLFTLCPISVYFAQETRVYALLMLAIAIVLWAAAVFQRDSRSIAANATYLFVATLCLYLHATAVLFVVACGAAVWFALLARGAEGRPALLRWTALNAVTLALGVPYFIHAATASHGGGLDWMPPLGLHEISVSISAVAGGIVMPYPWPAFPLAAALMASLAASIYWSPPSLRAIVTLVAVPCLFLALVIGVSLARPLLLPRVLAWTAAPLCTALAGQLLITAKSRFAVLAATVMAFGVGLAFQMTSLTSNKEPWREALREVGPQLARADLVVISPLFDPMVLRYYAPQVANIRLWDASLPTTIMNAAADRLHIRMISREEILQAIKSRRSIWVISNGFDAHYIEELRAIAPATVVKDWRCGGGICIEAAGWEQARRATTVDSLVSSAPAKPVISR